MEEPSSGHAQRADVVGAERRYADGHEPWKGVSPGALSAHKSAPSEIRRGRRRRGHSCWDHLAVAPLWVAFQANLGTLLRTCDAVPDTSHYRTALQQGDTLGPQRRPCVNWIRSNKDKWIEQQRADGWRIVAVELADGAVALPRLEPAKSRTVILLGHEWHGIPDDQVQASDVCVKIPMVGQGASLNVAVAGSLVPTASPEWREACLLHAGG
jgi:tRNA (guanosine-2'-O-)-methyltransferase